MADEAQKPEASNAEKFGKRLGGLASRFLKGAKAVIDDPKAALSKLEAEAEKLGKKVEDGARAFEKDPKGTFKAVVNKAEEPKEAPKAPEAKGPTGPAAP